MRRRLLLLALLAASGCKIQLDDPGTEPMPDQFYFPSGLAVDPAGQYLYVSSANADLKFGGGLLQVVDVDRFECARARFRGEPLGVLCDPVVADADLSQARCQPDPIDPSVTDCDEAPFILRNASVKLGNFAGAVRVRQTGPDTRTLFVAVRGDPSVTWIQVDLRRDPALPGLLDCFDDPASLTRRPGWNPVTSTTDEPPGCDGSHLVQTWDRCRGRVGCTEEAQQTPGEPFALALDEGKLPDGAPYARLMVSHLADGQVSLLDVLSLPPTVREVSDPFFVTEDVTRRGAFALAPQHAGDPSSLWYLTSNLQPTIATFRVSDEPRIVPAPSVNLLGPYNAGNDVRGIAFAPDGGRAFVTNNNPPSLAVLDTGPGPSGTPVNRVVDLIDVCQSPSHLEVVRVPVPGAPGAAPRLQSLVYVACFLSNQVMVIDPDRPGVDETVLVGRGPNDLALDSGAAGPRRAYVTNFVESSISVIDVEPGSPTRHRMIGRIGLPAPPEPL